MIWFYIWAGELNLKGLRCLFLAVSGLYEACVEVQYLSLTNKPLDIFPYQLSCLICPPLFCLWIQISSRQWSAICHQLLLGSKIFANKKDAIPNYKKHLSHWIFQFWKKIIILELRTNCFINSRHVWHSHQSSLLKNKKKYWHLWFHEDHLVSTKTLFSTKGSLV